MKSRTAAALLAGLGLAAGGATLAVDVGVGRGEQPRRGRHDPGHDTRHDPPPTRRRTTATDDAATDDAADEPVPAGARRRGSPTRCSR